ncbi:MAG: amidase, partial [Mycobacteriaceae bacterium]|nr:amidase [Mycobacteriaceae bacterium]
VPVAIKENVDVAGLPTLHGSAATARTPAAQDDVLVQRLRAAGAVVIAKTHMPELAIWPVTESAICNTRNPWDPTRSAGGSSGGSAAAVASGMAALAVGSDGGGSIRIPSVCCGTVGVKTTPGLVPLPGGAASHWYGLSVAGPIARTVDDAALMLDVLAGTDRFADPATPRERLRVNVSTRHPMLGARVDGQVRAAVQRVADVLRTTGHAVDHANPPYPALPHAFVAAFMAGIAEDADRLQLEVQRVEPRTRGLIAQGRLLRGRGLVRDVQTTPASRRLREWMGERDVLVAPVVAGPPPEIGRWWGQHWPHTLLAAAAWMGFAPPWNLAGCPAIAVPAGRSAAGLPLGVQLVGPPGSEARLLGVAKQVEQALG